MHPAVEAPPPLEALPHSELPTTAPPPQTARPHRRLRQVLWVYPHASSRCACTP